MKTTTRKVSPHDLRPGDHIRAVHFDGCKSLTGELVEISPWPCGNYFELMTAYAGMSVRKDQLVTIFNRGAR